MRTLKQIIADMKKNMSEQEAAFKAVTEATEEDAKTKAQEKLDGLKAAYENLNAEAQTVKSLMVAQDELSSLEELDTEPVVDAQKALNNAAPAEAKKHDVEEKARKDAFYKMISGSVDDVSGQERELLTPKSDSFKDGKTGIVMPKSCAQRSSERTTRRPTGTPRRLSR